MKQSKVFEELEKRFVNIIKLCDNPCYGKEDIRQVANDACSFIYLEQQKLLNHQTDNSTD